MLQFRIGGVPEHFNFPWHMPELKSICDDLEMNFIWEDFPGGTGAMNRALKDNHLDAAVILSAGVVRDIIIDNPARILFPYVTSSLNWGIHVNPNNSMVNSSELKGKRFAISRQGSGSQVISYFFHHINGWPTEQINFVETGGIQGAIEAINKDEADVIFWEKLMTKPFVESGNLKYIGSCLTPWPSFVVVVNEAFYEQHQEVIDAFKKRVVKHLSDFEQNKKNYIQGISNHYHLQSNDIENWIVDTNWATQPTVPQQVLYDLQKILFTAGASKYIVPEEFLVMNSNVLS